MASRVMASPVIFTWRAARSAISRTVCSRRWRYRSTSTITRSPSARCFPTITLVTDCSARKVSPRHPISAPRSRPLMSSVIGSVPVRTVTWARTPMCLSKPSTSDRATSALPLVGEAAAAPSDGAVWSRTLTSTTVSPGPSLMTRTSTFRRLSPSSIKAASTASSSVRPRPSADFIGLPPRLCSLFRPPRPRSVLRRGLQAGPRSAVFGTAPAFRHDRLCRPPSAPFRKQVSGPYDEVLLNDTDQVPDKPVEPEAGGNLEREVTDHQRRQPDHRPLHLLGLELLLGRVERRRLLQHLRLHERRDRRQQRKDQELGRGDRQAREQRVVHWDVVEVGHEQERLGRVARLREVLEHVVQGRQDRDLDDQRKAADQASERIDAVLLVQLHHFRVELLRILLVLLAQLTDLGRELALLNHGPPLGHQLELRQRRQGKPDDDRQDDDGDAVGADRVDDRNRRKVREQIQEERRQRLLDDRHPQMVEGQEDVENAAEGGAQVDVSFPPVNERSRNRIVAALGKRVAARDAHRAHPAAPEPAIPLHGFVRVMRARRVVPARRGKDLRKSQLVAADHRQKDRRHEFNFESLSAACSTSFSRSAKGSSSAAGRAIRTTSYRIPTPWSGESAPRSRFRANSRSRLRARLRLTERLTLRLTVTPMRLSAATTGVAKATSVGPE